MSKSLGNVVNPDDMIERYGADAMRLYEMFMGPLEATKPWSSKSIESVTRFLDRVWRLYVDEDGRPSAALAEAPAAEPERRVLHRTIRKVTQDLEALAFNTAIAQMMVFVNELTPLERRPREVLEPFVLLLAPFAPHLAEELWRRLGHAESLAYEPWPAWDPALVEQCQTIAAREAQRQASGDDRAAARHRGGGRPRLGARRPAGAQTPRRRPGAQGHLRQEQASEPGGRGQVGRSIRSIPAQRRDRRAGPSGRFRHASEEISHAAESGW